MANSLRKRNLINLLSLFLIFILLYTMITIVTINLTARNSKGAKITPTPILTENNILTNHQNVEFSVQGQEGIAQKINHREALSDNDKSVRDQLLNDIGNKSGTIYESPQVKITYIQEGDFFQAEILIPDIQTAKAEANLWLRNQGLTQQGVCNLPIQFYLNSDVSSQLKNSRIIFSPLPNGC